jgi:hypothetical protein
MPAVTAPLPRCLRCSADAATALPPKMMKEGAWYVLFVGDMFTAK